MHADKIWALDLHESIVPIEQDNVFEKSKTDIFQSKIIIITGGGDSTFKVWEDFTLQQQQIDKEENLKRIQQEQQLSHLIRGKDFEKAALMAFEMNKIRDFFKILERLVTKEEDEKMDQVDSVLKDIGRFNNLVDSGFSKAQALTEQSEAILTNIVTVLKKKDSARLLDMARKMNCKYEYSFIA